MRRILLIFLVALLPVQLAWAATAAYCQHESAMLSQHFGHHQHEHNADTGGKAPKKSALDVDCSICHAASVQAALPAQTRVVSADALPAMGWPHEQAFSSESARAPDRPQWLGLA